MKRSTHLGKYLLLKIDVTTLIFYCQDLPGSGLLIRRRLCLEMWVKLVFKNFKYFLKLLLLNMLIVYYFFKENYEYKEL